MGKGIYKKTEEHKRKIGIANHKALKGKWFPNQFQKKGIPWNKGKKTGIKPTNPFRKGHKVPQEWRDNLRKVLKGRKLPKETCIKMGNSRKGIRHHFFGKHLSFEHRRNLSLSKKGSVPWNKGRVGLQAKEKHWNWQGGKSFEEYGPEFDNQLKEQIRFRDNYKCKLCNCSQVENGKQLDIHHIDYDKKNNQFSNLIALCHRCHIKTNFKRDYWTEFFKRNNNKKEVFL